MGVVVWATMASQTQVFECLTKRELALLDVTLLEEFGFNQIYHFANLESTKTHYTMTLIWISPGIEQCVPPFLGLHHLIGLYILDFLFLLMCEK